MFDSVFDKYNFNCTVCFINSKIIDLKSQIYYLVNSLISFFFFITVEISAYRLKFIPRQAISRSSDRIFARTATATSREASNS